MGDKVNMRIFAAGGAGINLVSDWQKKTGTKESGFAEINSFFLDASKSNLRNLSVSEDHVYLVEGLDGSGKKRDSNYRIISERSKEMLHRFKPGDVNIVVHSGSGGTGSVIGPVLVSELLSRDAPTIVILVGSSDSRIEAENTIKTLKSYEVISKKRETPVIAVYYENSKETPRGQVDNRIQTMIVLLAALFSGQNRELDSADLRNFLDYTKVTSYPARLSYLDFFSRSIDLPRNQMPVAIVTLTDDSTDSSPNCPVEYQAVGFVDETVKKIVNVPMPVHAVVISGYFNDRIERLEARIAEIDEVRSAAVQKPIVTGDVKHEDDGLVL